VVRVYNAAGDASTQQDQLGRAKDDGADVFVLAAVDTDAGESMVEAAGEIPSVGRTTTSRSTAAGSGRCRPRRWSTQAARHPGS
jgi:hypothetical protein